MSKHLFVGGRADGEWREVSRRELDEECVRVMHINPVPKSVEFYMMTNDVITQTIKYDLYTARYFRVEGEEFVIFAEKNMTYKNVFLAILDGYRYE